MNEERNGYPYPCSLEYAKSCGEKELELYTISQYENCMCAKTIQDTLDNNFDGYHLSKDIEKGIVDEFGFDRVNFVLANTIILNIDDGRISDENKKWAKGFNISADKISDFNKRYEFMINTHIGLIDMFTKYVRREYKLLNLFDYSQCNSAEDVDFEGKLLILRPINLSDKYKNPDNQLIYCTGGFGCSPSASGRKVYGFFLKDGEKCCFERHDFVGELKAEHLPNWAKQKLEELGCTQYLQDNKPEMPFDIS